MTDAAPQTIHLADYTPPAYLVEQVHLTFRLRPTATRVVSRIRFCPNPEAVSGEFFLHGQDLVLISAAIDGQPITPELTKTGLTADVPDRAFVFEAEVEISPATNTALEGLYMSPLAAGGPPPRGAMFCTQCEAEGFRKITFYPDRPDVMAPFSVRIESDLPVLLSNGNPGDSGPGFAEWHDPWPKPAYLFALVAGDLRALKDSFTTASGRAVDLAIHTRPGPDEHKTAFAMAALKLSMDWDERVYGREYDLDVFNIVAVDDFNMGAMENKGLNIFNSSLVLASAETATDDDFERIEAVIAHEYFHNWTGNRITCRDWFQLCLKEGLTVFRDQQFTSEVRSAALKRIRDAQVLRTAQFREDNGPLAHPVRPDSFIEINNFYTLTVYEKGAEVIGMLKRIVGDGAYGAALDLYFARHDGQAATIEDWLTVFEDVTGRDLSQFKLWYSQAGTPRLTVAEDFENGRYTLHFTQENPPSPGQDRKAPQVLPIAFGLLAPDGTETHPTEIFEMTEISQSLVIDGLAARPVVSLLRDFSAPVIVRHDSSLADKALLLAHDTDPFARWNAGQQLTMDTLVAMTGTGAAPEPAYLDALAAAVLDETADPGLRAELLGTPGEATIAQELHDRGRIPDPDAIHQARGRFRDAVAGHLAAGLGALYASHQVSGPYRPEAAASDKRALANSALAFLTRRDPDLAQAQYAEGANMTQRMAALGALVAAGHGQPELSDFYTRFAGDKLVINKWFGLQASATPPDQALDRVRFLAKHADFEWQNPNRFRALLGGFAANHAAFHAADGTGYDLLAKWILRVDPVNPQTAARMTTAFQTWSRYDETHRAAARKALESIGTSPRLSPDTTEMVARLLTA